MASTSRILEENGKETKHEDVEKVELATATPKIIVDYCIACKRCRSLYLSRSVFTGNTRCEETLPSRDYT